MRKRTDAETLFEKAQKLSGIQLEEAVSSKLTQLRGVIVNPQHIGQESTHRRDCLRGLVLETVYDDPYFMDIACNLAFPTPMDTCPIPDIALVSVKGQTSSVGNLDEVIMLDIMNLSHTAFINEKRLDVRVVPILVYNLPKVRNTKKINTYIKMSRRYGVIPLSLEELFNDDIIKILFEKVSAAKPPHSWVFEDEDEDEEAFDPESYTPYWGDGDNREPGSLIKRSDPYNGKNWF